MENDFFGGFDSGDKLGPEPHEMIAAAVAVTWGHCLPAVPASSVSRVEGLQCPAASPTVTPAFPCMAVPAGQATILAVVATLTGECLRAVRVPAGSL